MKTFVLTSTSVGALPWKGWVDSMTMKTLFICFRLAKTDNFVTLKTPFSGSSPNKKEWIIGSARGWSIDYRPKFLWGCFGSARGRPRLMAGPMLLSRSITLRSCALCRVTSRQNQQVFFACHVHARGCSDFAICRFVAASSWWIKYVFFAFCFVWPVWC